MAYCTAAQVAAEFKGHPGFSATTTPTNTSVGGFIDEADAEIDGRLSQKYIVPITGTTSLLILRAVSIGIVKKRVADIMAIKSGGEADQDAGEDSAKVARTMLDAIVSGAIRLTDATAAVSGGGVRSYTYDEDIEPDFDQESDQW